MKILKQPEQSNLCGQTCLAMLADVEIDDVVEVIGKGGKTYNYDLIGGMRKLNIECAPKARRGIPDCDTAVVKIKMFNDRHIWHHWVLWVSGSIVIDPGKGTSTPALRYIEENFAMFTSFIEVDLKKN